MVPLHASHRQAPPVTTLKRRSIFFGNFLTESAGGGCHRSARRYSFLETCWKNSFRMLMTYDAHGDRDRRDLFSTDNQSNDAILVNSRSLPRTIARLKTTSGTGSHADTVCTLARMKRLRNRKINGTPRMELKKKTTDYTELAYREAILKLKYLLSGSYVGPTDVSGTKLQNIWRKGSNPRISESGEDTDDPSLISASPRNSRNRKDFSENAVSRTLSSKTIQQPLKTYGNVALLRADLRSFSPELASFIERQEDYIEQLERESQYCRNELMNLLSRVREVVAENEVLHSKNQGARLSKRISQKHENCLGAECHECRGQEANGQVDSSENRRLLEGSNIMLESRISELEAQLTRTKLELRKAQEENQTNLKRLSEGISNEGGIAELKIELDKSLRARYDAEMKADELQKLLSAARDKETEATQRAKRSVDDRQQIEFERSQSEMEIRRLRDELERQREKLREAVQETSRRITEERQQAERRCNQQIEQLTTDVASHWETANKSQLESEKLRRENNELRRESAQKQSAIDNLRKELQSKISTLQSDLNQALSEKDAAEQEVLTGKLTAERNERQARQEQGRSQAETNSYKQRLERADADLIHCRRENLRLSEQIASLEKEISMNKIARPEENRGQITPITGKSESERQLTSMIMDMQTKNAATAAGLEDTLNNQATLVSRLTAECQSLTRRLEANDLKHKKEMADLQSNVKHLSSKIQGTFASHEGEILTDAIDDANVDVNDQRYDANLDSTDRSSRDETDVRASRIAGQGYDPLSADDQLVTDQGSEMYSRMHERNARSRRNPSDTSPNDRAPVARDEPASETTTGNTGMYRQEGGGACSDDRAYADPSVDAYTTEQNYDRYNEYDASRYQEEQNDERFREITQESENNRIISDTAGSDH